MAYLSTKLPWELANTKWAATLNPVLALPMLNGNMISDISLTTNVPKAINHLLQRMPLGWVVIDKTTNANVWRTAPFTTTTLTLEATASTTLSIWVF